MEPPAGMKLFTAKLFHTEIFYFNNKTGAAIK